jgi:SAM-dependent methyltransferase
MLAALLSPAGQRLLAEIAAAYDESTALALGSRLRSTHDPALVAAALTQHALRRRAVAKFGADAARMYFTREALEQATTRAVAEHRAERLAAAGPGSLFDLGCGIGGDLIAFARRGLTVTGVDTDPLRVDLAAANLAALGLSAALAVTDACELDLSGYDLAYADPSRRGPRGRVIDVDDYAPPWAFVVRLLRRDACVKVAPGIPHRLVPAGVEAEWVSEGGEVKEAALWSGRLSTTGRRATVLPAGATVTGADDVAPAGVRPVGRYLYEPDGAVIRAGLVDAVAAVIGAGRLDAGIAYLTGDRLVATPLARAFEVTGRLPYREKPLCDALRRRGVGPLTVKKRGVAVEPESLRKRLALAGDAPATIVATLIDGRAGVLLVEPLAGDVQRSSSGTAAT